MLQKGDNVCVHFYKGQVKFEVSLIPGGFHSIIMDKGINKFHMSILKHS